MEKVLLDTDILSEYLKGRDANVVRRAIEYRQEFEFFTFTSVTVHEVVFGLESKGATAQLQKALAWFSQNEEITPAGHDYVAATRIKASARARGLSVELADCLIAAVAIRLGIPLVTGNTEDFAAMQKVAGALRLQNWRQE